MMQSVFKSFSLALCAGVLCSTALAADPRISEVYFNPPGNPDVAATGLEYIELYAGLNQSLDNYYFIALENENDEFNSQNPGQIENIFDLHGMTTGSNGYAVLAMKNSPYPQLSSVAFSVATPVIPAQPTPQESLKVLASGGHAYVNRDSGNGFGNGTTSSIGHSGQAAELEGSGATYLLIHVDPMAGGVAPVLNDDLDIDNDGFDGLPTGWTITDSIGVLGEAGEGYARFYSDVVFAPGAIAGPPGGVEPGADYINTTPTLNEIEYVGRVTPNDVASSWVVSNLTNDVATGYTAAQRNYAVSGNHALQNNPEVWVGNTSQPASFPYGTDITVTLGGPNVNFVVPEPGSFALAAIGGLGVLVGVLRRRRAA